MPISLHAAFVPSCLQLIAATGTLIDKAAAACAEQGKDFSSVADARLAPDMFDFCYQVKSMRVHSIGAIEGVRAGTFSPDLSEAPRDADGLKQVLDDARQKLEAVTVEEMESFVGAPAEFRFKDFVMPFKAEDFLLSFSQPNFYFHATTAYDLVRAQGIAIGKRDYLGTPRMTAPQ
ncbi:DUF1993 domain-containing protein [Croceicoccus naphthovorans]|uniref:Uncharacterized protein n=1 Tax=Croceicoccus naphthovorans TaxID=1348774 RepID=A0A0G3XFS5_9SPHN|nr:DUF1993 domain-containing protein [Croceicoccus naphthovorans]AKM09218.1 hypothetical protein AB433_03315 [Croceicoccus naphthovorans]MBB3990398.1 hypothetical protein [Croceicoccus naphthovorans]